MNDTFEDEQGENDVLAQYRIEDKAEPDAPSMVLSDNLIPRLEIRGVEGNRRSFPYSLLNYLYLDLSEGLTLVFVDCVITLRGQNLHRLYRELNGHTVKTIMVLRNECGSISKDAMLVDKCGITTPWDDKANES